MPNPSAQCPPLRFTAGFRLPVAAAAALWLGLAASAAPAAAVPRQDRPPRKVTIGTVTCGYAIFNQPLEVRLQQMDAYVQMMAYEAAGDPAVKQLDLVVLPETFLNRPGDIPEKEAVRIDEILPRIAACAKLHGCYIVAGALLQEPGPPLHYSNTALLVDRSGNLAGIYRKVHPVAPQGSDSVEGGTTPGRDFPVFDCDFGRLGMQICFDMLYPDGWAALAKQGAEIVAMPSASPDTVHPRTYAMEHQYYVVSATPRDHAAVYSPLGLIEAEATETGAVLVHQIDLSYAILHWEAVLDDGAALTRKYGDRVGYHYYRSEDAGIFWSNDPKTTIGQMISSLGLVDSDANVERIRQLDDKVRGGPPVMP